MEFFAILVSWLVLRYSDSLSVLQHDEWFESWYRHIEKTTLSHLGVVGVILVLLLVPVLTLGLVLQLFGGWLFGLVAVLLNVFVLLYACGRGDFDRDTSRYRNALYRKNDNETLALAGELFRVQGQNLGQVHDGVKRVLAYRGFECWFAPVFWFLMLGAPGALFYRLCHLLTEKEPGSVEYAGINDFAGVIIGWFDYVPARLWALAHALIADFNAVMNALTGKFFEAVSTVDYLDGVQTASIDHKWPLDEDGEDMPTSAAHELTRIENVQVRSMIVCLVFIAILYIVF